MRKLPGTSVYGFVLEVGIPVHDTDTICVLTFSVLQYGFMRVSTHGGWIGALGTYKLL